MPDTTINHDDHPEDIVDKVNKALATIGYAFVDDGQSHDGYVVFSLVETKPAPPIPMPSSLMRFKPMTVIDLRDGQEFVPPPDAIAIPSFHCPVCARLACGISIGPRFDSRCLAGHHWHRCLVHGTLVVGESDHANGGCSCRPQQ